VRLLNSLLADLNIQAHSQGGSVGSDEPPSVITVFVHVGMHKAEGKGEEKVSCYLPELGHFLSSESLVYSSLAA